MTKRRIDPWHELMFTARSALRNGASPAALAMAAERCMAPTGSTELAPLYLALKFLGLAWGRASASTHGYVASAVSSVLTSIDVELQTRIERPLEPAPKSKPPQGVPYYLQKDLRDE